MNKSELHDHLKRMRRHAKSLIHEAELDYAYQEIDTYDFNIICSLLEYAMEMIDLKLEKIIN